MDESTWYTALDDVLEHLPDTTLFNLLTSVQQWHIYQEYKRDPNNAIERIAQATGLTTDRVTGVVKLLEVHEIAQSMGIPEDLRHESYSIVMDNAFPPAIDTEFLFRQLAGGGFSELHDFETDDPNDTIPIDEAAAGYRTGFVTVDPDEPEDALTRQRAEAYVRPRRVSTARLRPGEFVSDPTAYEVMEPATTLPTLRRSTVFVDLDNEDLNMRIREPEGLLRSASLQERKVILSKYSALQGYPRRKPVKST